MQIITCRLLCRALDYNLSLTCNLKTALLVENKPKQWCIFFLFQDWAKNVSRELLPTPFFQVLSSCFIMALYISFLPPLNTGKSLAEQTPLLRVIDLGEN